MPHLDAETLALLALGEEAAAREDRAHLAACQECQAELDSLASLVQAARPSDGPEVLVTPPPRVWRAIESELGASPAPELKIMPRPRWRRILPVAIAAAAVAGGLIGGITGAVIARSGPAQTPAHSVVVARFALHPLPQFPRYRGALGTAALERQASGLRLTISVRAPAGPGFFEVWLLARNGVSMISLGDLNRDRTGSFAMPPGVDVRNYSRIDVSLQKFNGNPAHSKISVVRGSMPG